MTLATLRDKVREAEAALDRANTLRLKSPSNIGLRWCQRRAAEALARAKSELREAELLGEQ